MNLIKNTLLITLFLLLATPSFAETETKAKTYTIGVYEIPVMITSTDSGLFVELFKEAAKRANVNYKIEMYPSKRAVRYFQIGKVDGLFPAVDEREGFNAAKTETIYVKKYIIFVREDSELINNVDQLAGKTVGLTRGYHYDNRIFENPEIKIKYDQTDIINIQKLSVGSIDAFMVEEKTGLAALTESRATNIHYDPDSTLLGENVFFAFHNDDEGQVAANKMSKALIEMKKDGTFQKIMGTN